MLVGELEVNSCIPATPSLRWCCLGLGGFPGEYQGALERSHLVGTA